MKGDSIKFLVVNTNKDFSIEQFEEKIKKEYSIISFEKHYNPHLEATIKVLNDDLIYTIKFASSNYNEYKKISLIINNKIKKENSFDCFLENLKIKIKDILIETWEESHCFWIEDTQSEELSQNLYKDINKTENALRGFINICMIEYLGVYWWEKVLAEKFGTPLNIDKSNKYKNSFKMFNNIQDFLMTLNAEELKDVMKLEIKRWNIPDNLKELEKFLKLGDTNNFISKSKSYLVVEKSLWNDVFKKFFEKNFLGKWEEFCKGRNHIAHNKLIDSKYYLKFIKTMKEINIDINLAHDKFSTLNISNEEKEIIKYIAQEEAGVTIRDEAGIIELFEDQLNEFIDDIISDYSSMDTITIQEFSINIKQESKANILKIYSTIPNTNELTITYCCHIEDWESGNSYFEAIASLNEKEIARGRMSYTNGEYEFNNENTSYYPHTQDEFHIKEFKSFEEKIKEVIDENFEDTSSLIEKLKDENLIFFDSYCKLCGEEAVLKEKYYEIEKGKCLFCNYLNKISSCDRDGTEFIKKNDDELDLCSSCLEELKYKIDNE